MVVAQVAAGFCHSMALTSTGNLYTWGGGVSGGLGHVDEENTVVPRAVGGAGAVTGMAAASYHSLVTTREGRVLVFGDSRCGALGLVAEAQRALTPTTIDDGVVDDDIVGTDNLKRCLRSYSSTANKYSSSESFRIPRVYKMHNPLRFTFYKELNGKPLHTRPKLMTNDE